jgi:multiple sugar transport system substrate-binding protein
VPEWERIATQMRLTGERIVEGGVSVEQAVAELDRTVDGILEKRRSLLAPRGGG